MRYLLVFFFSLSAFAVSIEHKYNHKKYVSGTATGSSVLILDGYTDRCKLSISNTGASTIVLKVGSVHTGTEGLPIAPGTTYEPVIVPVGSLYIKSPSSSTFELQEGSCI